MEFSTILLIFFIIASVQPIVRQKMLESARRRMIGALEGKRKSRVIVLIHRQETLALLGFPLATLAFRIQRKSYAQLS